MSELEFQREKLYRVALSIAKSMLKNALISEEEYRQIDTILLEKYKPTLGTLLSTIHNLRTHKLDFLL